MQSANMKDFARTILFNALDKIIVISDFLKYDFASKTRIKDNKIETIYVGVDLAKFDSSINNTNVLRRDYNLNSDDIIIGLVGRIDTGKRTRQTYLCSQRYYSKFKNQKTGNYK